MSLHNKRVRTMLQTVLDSGIPRVKGGGLAGTNNAVQIGTHARLWEPSLQATVTAGACNSAFLNTPPAS